MHDLQVSDGRGRLVGSGGGSGGGIRGHGFGRGFRFPASVVPPVAARKPGDSRARRGHGTGAPVCRSGGGRPGRGAGPGGNLRRRRRRRILRRGVARRVVARRAVSGRGPVGRSLLRVLLRVLLGVLRGVPGGRSGFGLRHERAPPGGGSRVERSESRSPRSFRTDAARFLPTESRLEARFRKSRVSRVFPGSESGPAAARTTAGAGAPGRDSAAGGPGCGWPAGLRRSEPSPDAGQKRRGRRRRISPTGQEAQQEEHAVPSPPAGLATGDPRVPDGVVRLDEPGSLRDLVPEPLPVVFDLGDGALSGSGGLLANLRDRVPGALLGIAARNRCSESLLAGPDLLPGRRGPLLGPPGGGGRGVAEVARVLPDLLPQGSGHGGWPGPLLAGLSGRRRSRAPRRTGTGPGLTGSGAVLGSPSVVPPAPAFGRSCR